MAQLNWKYETGADAVRRFSQATAERYRQEGLTSLSGEPCPYPPTSFAAIHWRRGAASKEGESA